MRLLRCARNNFRYKLQYVHSCGRMMSIPAIFLHHNPVYFEPISMQTRTYVRHVQHLYILNLILLRLKETRTRVVYIRIEHYFSEYICQCYI